MTPNEQKDIIDELCSRNCLTWAAAGNDFYCIPRYCKNLFRYAKESDIDPDSLGLVGGC
jgi:hypothetical protein